MMKMYLARRDEGGGGGRPRQEIVARTFGRSWKQMSSTSSDALEKYCIYLLVSSRCLAETEEQASAARTKMKRNAILD